MSQSMLKPVSFVWNPVRLFSASQSLTKYVFQPTYHKGKPLLPFKAMAKILDRHTTRKKGRFENPLLALPSITISNAVSSMNFSTELTRRMVVLNKLFMHYVTELLSTNEFATELYGEDIQISDVRIAQNFQHLYVYWIPNASDDSEVIQEKLNMVAGPLRSELSKLGVIGGVIPYIRFIKDKRYALMIEVDRRLKIADFGEDYVPTFSQKEVARNELYLKTKIPEELKKQIWSLEEEITISQEEVEEIPPVSYDVFGLDYQKIANDIMVNRKKDTAAMNLLRDVVEETSKAVKTNVFDVEPWDKTAFQKYLRQQQIQNRKILRTERRMSQMRMADKLVEQYCRDDKPDYDAEYEEFSKHVFEDQFHHLEEDDRHSCEAS